MSSSTWILWGLMIGLGLFAGTLGGMFGIGGGLIIVPFLALVVGLGQKESIGTSVLALTLPAGIWGAQEYWRRGECRIGYALWIGLGLFVGNRLGALATGHFSPSTMKKVYGIFLLIIGSYYVFFTKPTKPKPAAGIAPAASAPKGQDHFPPDMS